jgi:hypothetical protein
MTYTQEAKEVTQNQYGGYCNMVREMGLLIVPYHNFNISVYTQTKTLHKEFKNDRKTNNNL